MTSNLILMTRDLPLSPSQVQKWDQSRQLVQYKLSSESQPLPSYLILHYGPPLDPSYLEGFIEAIEIREYEMVQHNPPFQKEVESPGPYHFHPTLSHPSLTTHSAVKDPKHGTHLLLESLTPADGSDDDVDSWYREQYIPDLAKLPTYLLTKRYKLIGSQANVENLPPGKMHWASPPPYLTLHEFNGEKLDAAALVATSTEGDWDRKIRAGMQSGKFKLITYSFHARRYASFAFLQRVGHCS